MKHYHFANLGDMSSMSSLENNLSNALNMVKYPETQAFVSQLVVAVHSIRELVNHFSTDNQVEEWLAAAKKHKDVVATIMSDMIEISEAYGVSNPIESVSRTCIKLYNGEVIEERGIKPRSFWKLYSLIRFLAFCETADQLIMVQRAIVSVFVIYKDLRASGSLLDSCTLDHVKEMQDDSLMKAHNTDMINIVSEFLNLCDKCITDPNLLKSQGFALQSYLSTFIKARKEFVRPDMGPDSLPKSMKSSGSRSGDTTIPSLLASLFEDDLIQDIASDFDELVGYTFPTTLAKPSNFKQVRNKCVAISHTSKPDVRLIHIADNAIQDRMNYFSRVRKQWLKMRPTIAIWNQKKAVNDIQQWFVRRCKAIYSLDLHAATDTLSRYQQAEVLKHHLRWMGYNEEEISILTCFWLNVMSLPSYINLPHSNKRVDFTMITGQPMGFEDSVFSLNDAHDTWVAALTWYVEKEYNLQCISYRVLGDDFSIAFKSDPQFIFPKVYQELMAQLNTVCNLSKGYIYNQDIPEYNKPLAEFAKSLICGGVNITPFPLGALFKGITLEEKFSFLSWIQDHDDREFVVELDYILSFIPEDLKPVVLLMIGSGIPNHFSKLVGADKIMLPDIYGKALLPMALALLRESVFMSTLLNVTTEANYTPKFSDYRSFKGIWRRFARSIQCRQPELENHKLIAYLTNLELTAIAQGILVSELTSGISIISDNFSTDLLDFVPEFKAYAGPDTSDLFSSLALALSMEKSGESLSQSDIGTMLYLLQTTVGIYDLNRTDRRFGNNSGVEVIQGMELSRIRESYNCFLNFLGYEVELNPTLNYIVQRFSKCSPLKWETDMLTHVLENQEDDMDLWEFLGY